MIGIMKDKQTGLRGQVQGKYQVDWGNKARKKNGSEVTRGEKRENRNEGAARERNKRERVGQERP